MGCDSFVMQTTLDGLRAGKASTDGLVDLIRSCPEVCDQVYGTTDFNLAGPGVLLAVIVQGVLVLALGLLVSFASYVMSSHATTAARLTVARLKVIFDTVHSTGLLVYIALLITSFVRLYQGVETGAFERIVIHDILSLQRAMAYLGLNSIMIYRTPTKIKQRAQSWGLERAWPAMLPFDLATNFVTSMTAGLPTDPVVRLCEAGDRSLYPHVHKPVHWSLQIWVLCVAILGTIVLLILNGIIRSAVWKWLKRIFTSRVMISVAVAAWTLMNLVILVAYNWDLWYTRQAMFSRTKDGNAQWDLAQVLILTAWLPALYRMILTILVYLKTYPYTPPKGSASGWASVGDLLTDMYTSNVGEEPRVEMQSDEYKPKSEAIQELGPAENREEKH